MILPIGDNHQIDGDRRRAIFNYQGGYAHYVYRFYGPSAALLYVGYTGNLEARMGFHRREKPWWPQVCAAVLEAHISRRAALVAELQAILNESPVHNIRRAKSHVF